jgi:hypothetical protein
MTVRQLKADLNDGKGETVRPNMAILKTLCDFAEENGLGPRHNFCCQ